jgi:hypothetical protein
MNPSERFFVTYATLAILSVAWGVWRILRTPTVRKAVEALPLAMIPAWIATSYVAFQFGGWDLVLKTLGVGVLSLAGLWALRFGVDVDSGPIELPYEGPDE